MQLATNCQLSFANCKLYNMEHLFTSESLISFVVLVILEVVLGIDNVIFVSIILNRLKKIKDQKKARRIWMITGILSRSLMLMGLGWLLNPFLQSQVKDLT